MSVVINKWKYEGDGVTINRLGDKSGTMQWFVLWPIKDRNKCTT